jgi:hypothetical protein
MMMNKVWMNSKKKKWKRIIFYTDTLLFIKFEKQKTIFIIQREAKRKDKRENQKIIKFLILLFEEKNFF